MRLLLYGLTAWVVLSIPAALFFGRLCRLSEDPFDVTARPPSTPSHHRLKSRRRVRAARPLTTPAVTFDRERVGRLDLQPPSAARLRDVGLGTPVCYQQAGAPGNRAPAQSTMSNETTIRREC